MKKKSLIKIVAIISIAISSIVSYSFVDSYFEVSKNLDIFATLFRELNIYYVDDTDPGDLMKTGIDAMLKSLDPYTTYIPESKIEDYRMMTTGQYGGIGALIQKHGEHVVISEPYEGFGAFKAGLMAGDKLLEIDGKSVIGKNTSDVRDFLLGQPGTTLTLKIERPGESNPLTKTVTREEVKIKDVPFSGMLNDSIGYIKLTSFTESASSEFKAALHQLKEKNVQSIIFDLRGNGGGLLRESVNIVNVFVEMGSEIVSTKGKIKEWDKSYKALSPPIDIEIPLVILIDGNSASASEIVSGSLQDHDRAVIIGSQSYGKGLVQQARPLSYNSRLKVTVAKYYTPSGRCIQKLDYSNRNGDGSVVEVADSLITEFKTLHNKRSVFDGKGVTPDINVKREALSDISISLFVKQLIFDYATKYKLAHPSINSSSEFSLTDKEYEEFVKFLSDKDYEYTTESEKLIETIEETTKKDKYFEDIEAEYTALKNKLNHNKKEDLYKFKDEIKRILGQEIVARYYYQKGQVEFSLKYDPYIEEAVKTLNNQEIYNSILKGTAK